MLFPILGAKFEKDLDREENDKRIKRKII